jgi:hypothetical protein
MGKIMNSLLERIAMWALEGLQFLTEYCAVKELLGYRSAEVKGHLA